MTGFWQRVLGRTETDNRKNVLVFGTGRSGTTWLAEVIAAAGLKLIFEPLHPTEVPEAQGFPFPNYLVPGDQTPWEPLLAKVAAGTVENDWTLRANPGAQRAVVKLIRANLMMEWMLDHFDFFPVLIIRNPLSVAGSMKEQGWDVGTKYVQYAMEGIGRKDGAFENFDNLFDHEITAVESYAVMWGFQNCVPKNRGLFEKVHLLRFEKLALDPEATFMPLARSIGIEVDPKVKEQLHKLSFQRGLQSWKAGYNPVTAWKRSLTEQEVDDVCRIVHRFGLEEFLVLD